MMQFGGEAYDSTPLAPLPEPWEMRIDERTGWPYFLNHADKTTTWEDPRLAMRRSPHLQRDNDFRNNGSPRTDSVEIPVRVQQDDVDSVRDRGFDQNFSFGPAARPHGVTPGPNMRHGFTSAFPTQSQDFQDRTHKLHTTDGISPCGSRKVYQQEESSARRRSVSPRRRSASPRQRSVSPRAGTASCQATTAGSAGQSDQPHHADVSSQSTFDRNQSNTQTNQSSHQPSPESDKQNLEQQKAFMKPAKKTPQELIDEVQADAETYRPKIESFSGSKDSQEYKYLEEMLERNLIRLDNVEANGNDSIRAKRKETVRYIQQSLDQLELKALANDSPGS